MVLELNAVQPNDNAAIKQMELLTKLQKELVSIEIEAVEFGLPVVKDEHEDPPLLNAFREGDIKEKLRDEITKWTLIRNALLDKISKARAGQNGVTPSGVAKYVIELFANMREVNSEFIEAICGELLIAERVEV